MILKVNRITSANDPDDQTNDNNNAGGADSEWDTRNLSTDGTKEDGTIWKKIESVDKPPEWNGEDPTNQAEPYLNLLHMWKETTGREKKKQAKQDGDRPHEGGVARTGIGLTSTRRW